MFPGTGKCPWAYNFPLLRILRLVSWNSLYILKYTKPYTHEFLYPLTLFLLIYLTQVPFSVILLIVSICAYHPILSHYSVLKQILFLSAP